MRTPTEEEFKKSEEFCAEPELNDGSMKDMYWKMKREFPTRRLSIGELFDHIVKRNIRESQLIAQREMHRRAKEE